MFGLDPRTLKIVWTVFFFALITWLVYTIGHTLVIFTLAIFMAHLLGPITERVERMIPEKWVSRGLSLAIVYVLLLGVLTAILIPVVGQVSEQAATLATRLPTYLQEDPLTKLGLPVWLEPLRTRLNIVLSDSFTGLDEKLLPALKDVGSNLAGILGNAVAIVLIPILSFFFLKNSEDLASALIDFAPPDHRAVAREILHDLHTLLVQYLRALVVLALLVFVAYTLFLSATNLSYAVLLATLAALLEFVPIAGPLVGGVLIVLVALLTGFPHVWWLVIFLILFRLVQDYIVNPYLMSAGVEIHPLAVLFGVLAGEQIAGIPGMFFSVPVIAALRVVFVRMRRRNVAPDPEVSLE